jgi:hypothetical protein
MLRVCASVLVRHATLLRAYQCVFVVPLSLPDAFQALMHRARLRHSHNSLYQGERAC